MSTGQAVVAMSPHPPTLRKSIVEAVCLCRYVHSTRLFPLKKFYIVLDEKLVEYAKKIK